MSLRPDLAAIAAHVMPGSRVLDIGCGDGALMAELEAVSGCDARGMELDGELVERCVSRGLSVVHSALPGAPTCCDSSKCDAK